MNSSQTLETVGEKHGISSSEIGDQMSKAILAALGDDFSDKILSCTNEKARTVEEISSLEGIPLSTCYRRIRHLVDSGLLLIERIVITNSGRRFAEYRSSFASFQVSFDPTGTHVQASLNQDVADKVRCRQLQIAYGHQNGDVA